MLEPQKFGRFAAFLGVLAACLFIILPTKADAAASLYVAPPSGTFILGNTFTVSLYVNTGGQSINAVEANLSFPPDKLQVVSPTTGKSFIQVWVSQPTYSNENGTLKFQGTIPTPGINTDAGLVSTVTFRVKTPGTATVRFLDSSRVLLNDGRGTDVLGQKTDGIYYLTLPPPQGPVLTSRTNPDQEKWYNDNSVVFEWAAPLDIGGYSYILDQNPVSEPDDISEGVKTRVVYNNLPDRTFYFHIKALRQGAWGGVTDYVVHIDRTPPAAFQINFSPGRETSNHRPIIDFRTTDETSGVDHYELKIIPLDPPLALAGQNTTPFFIEVGPPYSRNLDDGRYDIVVRAYDEADNYYQAESRLTVTEPLFEIVSGAGVRIGGVYTLGWPYVGILSLILLAVLAYLTRLAWKWHSEVEEHLGRGAHEHPAVSGKWQALKEKLKEYGSSLHGGAGGKGLTVLLIVFAAWALWFAPCPALANPADNVPLEPPVVTLFPKSISNDEILYIGGRAGAPQAQVLIYLQQTETGTTLSETAVTDKTGAWFYSLPQFLDAGHYIVWTQLKVAEQTSPPSARMDLVVAETAIQIGSYRLSYQDFYFILLLVFAVAFLALLSFFLYHTYHFRTKTRRLNEMIKEAEESVRRGFSVLRHDIELELNLIRKAKLSKELSVEEKLREEKLLKDLDVVSNYIGREVWKVEEAEKEL
jgi:hypothetical protein